MLADKIKISKKMGRPSRKPDLPMLKMMYEKYTSAEIADMFGVSPSTVRTWVYRAKKAGDII